MIDTNPYPLTKAEWKEISEVPAVREAWGLQAGEDDPETLASLIYAAKFNYVSGGPGYVGDLFVLQGDVLTEHSPFVLQRGQDGKLMVRIKGFTQSKVSIPNALNIVEPSLVT